MRRAGRKTEWAVVLFVVGLIFLFPPIVSLFNKPDLVFGLPLSYLVLYGGWALIILAVALGARRREQPTTPPANGERGDD